LTERALPPSEWVPAIWAELEDVVLGALALDPDDRYPDMRSFAGALRRAVLQREASTALVASDPFGPAGPVGLAPTPLARSLATRRLTDEDTAPMLALSASEPATADPGRAKRRGFIGPMPLLGLIAVSLVTAVCAFSTLAVMNNLGGLFNRPGVSYVTIQVPAPTATPRPTPTPRPTATPRPAPSATMVVNKSSINPCKLASFQLTYIGSPGSVTATLSTSPNDPTIHFYYGSFSPTTQVTLTSGKAATIYVSRSGGAASPGTILATIANPALNASLKYSC
jgi:hypothetical protein